MNDMGEKETKQENEVVDSASDTKSKKAEIETKALDIKDSDIVDEKNKEKDIEVEEKSAEENLELEINKLKDEKLRLLAEMENLRKRADREKIDSLRYGSINLARDILSPDDNLTRALNAIPEEEKNSETVNNLIDGLKMVQKEFSSILEKHGVKKIESLNMKFDHNFHQAMVEIENDEVDEGIVIQEMQSGYIMHDRLLRPSMVAVSKKSKKPENENKDIDEAE
jgi:molecular chaperone GrpE